MTHTLEASHPETHIPFGAGAVVGDTFSIFFRKIHLVILLGFIPALIEVILNGYALNQPIEDVAIENFDAAAFGSAFAVTFLISLVAVAITTAMVIQLAYDAKLERPARIGKYFSAALVNLPAIAVLSVITSLLYMVGLVVFILPGVWLYAVFSVLVPAIVIDGAGFGAMRRSANLTKNYRWPIIGTLILVSLCVFLVAFVIGFVFAMFAGGFSTDQGAASLLGPWMIIEAVINAISYGWLSIAVALIFARLKEIKEGVSVSDLVDVFK